MKQQKSSSKLRKLNGQLTNAISLISNEDGVENFGIMKREFGECKNAGFADEQSTEIKKKEESPCTFVTPSLNKIPAGSSVPRLANENSSHNIAFRKNNVNEYHQIDLTLKDNKDPFTWAQPIEIDRLPENGHPSCSNNPSSSCALPACVHPSPSSGNSASTRRRKSGSEDKLIRHDLHKSEQDSWIRRKFYIVENSGKATEVYCTDLIHKVKKGISGRHGRNRALLRITDKWREEWNHGVQVPLGTSKEIFDFEDSALFPKMAEQEYFQLPSKLICSSPLTKYVNANDYRTIVRPPIFYYNMDQEDEIYLEKKATGAEQPISSRSFVEIMNYLEVSTYQQIHNALLEPRKIRKKNSEDDAECNICRLPVWEPGDQIVFCDGCNISVHQVCYGISTVPTGSWYCQLCNHFGEPTLKECLFCPVKGGAMKATKNKDSWAHIVCALYIPEVRFGDAELREPITHFNEIPVEKRQSRCCVCDTTRIGACIKCTHPKCDATFHVSCAQQSNFVLDICNDEHEKNGVKYISLCGKHSSKNPRKERNARFTTNRLTELHMNFEQYADWKEVSDFMNITPRIAKHIYNYWVWKRKQNKFRPLIDEPEDNKLVFGKESIATVELSKRTRKYESSSAKKRRIATSYADQLKLTPHLLTTAQNLQLESLGRLRIHFEKTRNLCHMVSRREKQKKRSVELFGQHVHATAKKLLNPELPLSSRKEERLLGEWLQAINLGKASSESGHN